MTVEDNGQSVQVLDTGAGRSLVKNDVLDIRTRVNDEWKSKLTDFNGHVIPNLRTRNVQITVENCANDSAASFRLTPVTFTRLELT